jgi:hypothetical protein
MTKRRLGCAVAALGVLTILTACQPSGGTTYYVSPSGEDTADGRSEASAWRTIARVNGADLGPGDVVRFEGGARFAGTLHLEASDGGTAASPVTIESYDGTATIDGGTGTAVFAHQVGGVRVRNLRAEGSGASSNTSEGIGFYNDLPGDVVLGGITVEDVDVSGFGTWGVILGGGAGRSGYRDVRFERVAVHGNGRGGLLTWGMTSAVHRNVYAGRITAYDNLGTADPARNSGSGIVLGNVDGGTVEHSVAYGNGGSNTLAGEGPEGIWAYDSNRVVIQFNESYGNRTGTTTDGGGFGLDQNTSNSVLQYNLSHGNAGPAVLLAQRADTTTHTGNVVRYNISYDDGRRGRAGAIELWGGIRSAELYHNTVYLPGPFVTGQRAVKVWNSSGAPGATHSVHFRNNVVVARGGTTPLLELGAGQVAGSVDLRFQGNDWWTGASSSRWMWGSTSYWSLTEWRTATGQERVGSTAVGRNVDPRLVAPGPTATGHRLQSSSPLVDAGLSLSQFGIDPGGRDHFGAPAPEGPAPDIGAHELR